MSTTPRLLGILIPLSITVAALAPAAAAAPIGRYVALGDSYAAAGTLTDLADGPLGCARARDDYPGDLARTLGVAQFVDVSCGSATTADMARPQVTPAGVNAPQFDALTPDTDLVTISIGGNDFGFADIAVRCGALGIVDPVGAPCRALLNLGGDQIGGRLADVAPRVGAVLDEIHRRAPHATVVMTGYLPIVPAIGGCWPNMPIASGDVPFLAEVTARLNGMLADTAAAHDARFVDPAPQPGHDACQAPGQRWVEGPVPDSPSLSVHPNAAGQAYMAQRAADGLAR
ncbi:SGNH/GDSL hydrolase family protein [Nocardia pseudobrasiliensis]|uniref:GDSL-like lipase/acylhydrolase family protein n=1 Tax=Nocardia pseudobrasiliensis TaxID=45979 RepID=A0A370IBX5_9NOCA|nr:SGNH/GDSL hydrolase family protein [Nocardia pseudobrasiliensis]RDI68193.1 GDSL-like lipase/acylhydrolase family protein [Nocardia pseudobrasiliensis]